VPPNIRHHPLQWIFEPFETEPFFFQEAMFGCQGGCYLFGKLVLVLAANEEP